MIGREQNKRTAAGRSGIRRSLRLPPCPSCDVEGMESWLTDLAADGWLLEKEGVFAGIYSFVREGKSSVRYRLDAAARSTGIFSENYGEPDEEAVAIGERYGWNYVATCRDFHIWRTEDPEARELNTDPAVQEIALSQVRKRHRAAVIENILWLVLYPLLWIRGNVLLTMLSFGTGFVLFGIFLALWLFAGSAARLIRLTRLKKRLADMDHGKNWKKRALMHQTLTVLKILLIALWVILLFGRLSDQILEEGQIPLSEYTETLPFAGLRDFAAHTGQAYSDYKVTFPSLTYAEKKTDILAPVSIRYHETADVTLADGTDFGGGLAVDYHEAASERIASALAAEYVRAAKGEKDFRETAVPHEGMADADFVMTYTDHLHFPAVILRKGCVVMRASFYQTGDTALSEEDWMGILARSLSRAAE